MIEEVVQWCKRCGLSVMALLALSLPAGAEGGLVEIDALSLSEVEGGLVLQVRAASKLDWSAELEDAQTLVIHLPNTFPGPGVEGLAPASGPVVAVAVRPEVSASEPSTRLTVRTRGQAAYQVRGVENGLTVRFSESDPAPLEAEPPLTPQAPVEEPFRIGPRDVLKIEVFGQSDLNRTVRVLSDGTISMPLLGTLSVGGLSLEAAERRIEDLLADQDLVRRPQVSIFVEEMVSQGVYVQGAVGKPGTYQLVAGNRLMDVLGQAGGLLSKDEERADRHLYVLRSGPGGTQEKVEVDISALIERGDLSQNVELRAGDTVMVPFAKTYKVFVTGAVQKPGAIPFVSSDGITVLQAVTAAGGPTERANLGNVKILRTLEDGSQERVEVNLKKIQKGKRADVGLEQNDVVVVPEWFL